MNYAFGEQSRKKGKGLLFKMLTLLLLSCFLFIGNSQHIFGYTAVRGTITVKSGKARKEASTDSSMVFGVIKDETVTIIGEEKGKDGKTWYKVKVMNSVGYLRSDLVKKSNVVVKSESTNEPTKNTSEAVKTVQTLEKTSTDAKNTQTSADASTTTSQSGSPCVKGTNVIVREEASTRSGVRVVVQNGMALNIIGTVTGADDGREWRNVSFKLNNNEYKGYIRSDLVNMNGAAASVEKAANSDNTDTSDNKETKNEDQKKDSDSKENKTETSAGITPQVGKIKGIGVNIRKAPISGEIVCQLSTGQQITAVNQVKADDGTIWYSISFLYNKMPKSGYVRSDYTDGIVVDEKAINNTDNSSEEKKEENKEDKKDESKEEKKEETENKQETTASIKGIGVRIREKAVDGNIITQLDTGYPIEILEEVQGGDGHTWFKIRFSKNDKVREGYVRSDLVSIVSSNYSNTVSDQEFEDQISEFPDSYKASLRALHEKYPNWKFVPVNTGLQWDDVVTNESTVGKNLVAKTSIASWKSTAPQAYNWSTNTWYGFDGGSWAAASTELIQYYLDPRNFLDDSGIFQFETLGFEDYQNKDGVANVLSGTFMSGAYKDSDGADRNYVDTFYEAGQACGINPYHLASKAIQEQGVSGTSQSVSGTVSGLENLFNYFNIGAYASNGRTATINGLYYAAGNDETYLRPWNTRYRSILGSAKYIADKYIAVGQNTLYFQKFNVVNKTNGIYSHQYMSNVVAASYESARIRKAYSDLNTTLVFRIPYYSNMPSAKCVKPTSDSNPNTYLSNLWVEGYSFTTQFSSINSTYYLTVGNEVTSINIGASAVSSSSSVAGTGTYPLNSGENKFQVTCKAQSGATKTYTIVVNRQ